MTNETFTIYTTNILIALLVAGSLWTVLTSTLLRSAIGLALTSAVLTLIMFQMGAPLAGVFELSVCAGLITVVFVSAISLTRRVPRAPIADRQKARAKRFLPLLLVSALVGALLWKTGYVLDTKPPVAVHGGVREILWTLRRLDLLGQIIIIFAGVFGVVILFKERKTGDDQDKKEVSR